MKWTEQHQLRARGQAGFRKDHRTTDQTFVVRTLIEKAKADKQPLYSCFVDFKKAYDTVPRDLLWEKLQRIGVHDIDIDYILVVGHFGLATGSGGNNPEQHAQRVVSKTVHVPLTRMSTQSWLEQHPSNSAQ